MYNHITVRLVDDKTDKMIRAYTTTNLSETLKMYEAMIDNERLSINIPEQDREDDYNDGYNNIEAQVTGVEVNFGDDEYCLLSINVYVRTYM